MTSYFKFLEWWIHALGPEHENWLAMGEATVALENALVGNIEKRYSQKCSGKYPLNWMHNRWDSIQWL